MAEEFGGDKKDVVSLSGCVCLHILVSCNTTRERYKNNKKSIPPKEEYGGNDSSGVRRLG
jgi:hypothetical protein